MVKHNRKTNVGGCWGTLSSIFILSSNQLEKWMCVEGCTILLYVFMNF
jgi:hypothetical protein